jgi:hypothetical protein
MECRRDDDSLFHLDVGGPDHLSPPLGFVGDELAEIGGRARKHHTTQTREPRFQIGISESSINLTIDLVDNRNRRLLWSRDTVPDACFIAPNELTWASQTAAPNWAGWPVSACKAMPLLALRGRAYEKARASSLVAPRYNLMTTRTPCSGVAPSGTHKKTDLAYTRPATYPAQQPGSQQRG